MAEATVVETPSEITPVIPVVEPDVSRETSTDDVVIDDGKPGGDDPQAVRARKEYQARKRAEQQAEAQRIENVRLAERLKVIEEERAKAKTPPAKIYSIPELDEAVERGQITSADRGRYIQEVIIPKAAAKVVEDREAALASRAPVMAAVKEIDEYRKYIPGLNDKTSPEFQKVANEYFSLVNQGLPKNEVTEALAVKLAHGHLDAFRRKAELAAANATHRGMPSDSSSGGAAAVKSGKVDVSKAPPTMVAMWDREGVDDATRERRYKIYLELKGRETKR